VEGADLDAKAVTIEYGAQRRTSRALVRVEPHDQHAGGAYEVHQPIERGLDRLDRALPAIEKGHVVLPGREAAVRRGRRSLVPEPMQIDHDLGTFRTGHDDAGEFRAARQRNHRLDDALACCRDADRFHDCHLSLTCDVAGTRRVRAERRRRSDSERGVSR
jgi:hypothetical protein